MRGLCAMEQGSFGLWLGRFGAFGGILMLTVPNSNIGRGTS